jgi:hypothetical protein
MPVTFPGYYRRYFGWFLRDFFRIGISQVIGLLLAVAILVLQLHWHLIPSQLSLRAYESILWPYAIVLVVLSMLCAIRAPVGLDREREMVDGRLQEKITELEVEQSRLRAVAYPEVPAEELDRRRTVREILSTFNFSKEVKAALRRTLNFGGAIQPSTTGLGMMGSRVVSDLLSRGISSGLIVNDGGVFRIRPELQATLRFVLDNEEP